VLDPRADTETLVEAALELMPARARVLDLGTGSGCVLISVLARALDARGLGVDISAGALRLARQNAHLHNVRDRIGLRQGRWFSRVSGRFDIIVSNPPYIARGEIDHLATEVRAHDPRRALDGGPDGLDAYRHICSAAPVYLEAGGHLLLEIGFDQAQSVSALMRAQGFENLSVDKDLEGRARVVRGQIKKTKKGV
jgi:release factor glutamine methyltransferase